MPSFPSRHHVPAPAPRGALLSGAALSLMALSIGLLLGGERPPFFQSLDDSWARWMGGGGSGSAADFAYLLDRLGGPLGVVFPLALTGGLCVYGRWRSGLFVFAASVVANMLVVLPLKSMVDRPRPPHPLVLVNAGSYPSGQVFTAVTLVMVIGVVLFSPRTRRWWWLFGALYVAAMMWSRTWLHAQWLSDTAAGALAGGGVCLLLHRAFAPLLEREAALAAEDRLWL
ncbi:phosphatase PAP2 family protein [Streptomyces sp. ISL-44]|uniref:phosphatase PAP2 family protein n=1 Tax=Streptomyces sp. ISL-44 TaxID=2819184 RepID=UPI001BE825E8|nr:phosphatase PAP2 family protein [Streptomyces sp. ISL-44]MBT2541092.1 phosphatase PAP2 family protein [Streptomyces sp. ISL-44]